VHQLRVATRRIDAVLHLFEPLYPPRRLKKARKQVRRVRRSARQVRDLDVLLDGLPRSGEPGDGLSALAAELRLRRDDAMRELRRVLRKRRRRRLQVRLTRLRPVSDADGPLSREQPVESTAMLMRPCVAAFQTAASADLSDTSALHRFRLQSKQLRYTLELLWGTRNSGATAEFTQLLKDLQEELGQINDHASAVDILVKIADASPDSVVQLEARRVAGHEVRRLDEGKADFLRWWTAEGAVQTRTALDGVLSGGAAEAIEKTANPAALPQPGFRHNWASVRGS
jgi:CHAD domain-containing protein